MSLGNFDFLQGVEAAHVKIAHNVSFCWDWSLANPHLEFRLGFVMPSPRKIRIITERDELGRIIKAKVPELKEYDEKISI